MSGSSDSWDDPKIGPRAVRLGQVWEAANMLSAAQVSKHVSGNTRHSANGYGSLAPLRDRFLHADVPPPSHPLSRSRLVVVCCLVGLILAITISSVIVFGQLRVADIWHRPDDDHSWTRLNRAASALPGGQAIPRLIVQSARRMTGEPVPLGLAIYSPAEGAIVIITGLLAGMEVSTGVEVGALPEDVGYAFIAPPENFVGSANLVAELRLADDKIVDRQPIYLEWVPPSPLVLASERGLEKVAAASSPSLAPSQSGREEAGVLPSYPRIAQKQADQEQPVAGSSLPTLAKRQLDREEITVLLKVGKDLIASGDIAAARLTLKRAADAGDAEAALALASTYDPYVLRELKVYGFSADAAMARAWYEKAKDFGSAVAPRRLEILARGAR